MTSPYRDKTETALARVTSGDKLRRRVAEACVRWGEAVRRRFVLEYEIPPPEPPAPGVVDVVGGVVVCYRPGMFAGKRGLALLTRIFGEPEPAGGPR